MAVVKICGLTRAVDARAAEAAGAVYGGVILAPGSRRSMPPEAVDGIFGGTSLLRCGVFVDAPYDHLAEQARSLSLRVLQLHGDESPELAASLRRPGLEVWKALRPRSGDEFAAGLDRFAGSVDGILLDGWSSAGHGGTGTAFPWADVVQHRAKLPPAIRLVVAGGLTPDNVAAAIRMLRPDVVDVSSGVEQAPGIKDESEVHRFAKAATRANDMPAGGPMAGESVNREQH